MILLLPTIVKTKADLQKNTKKGTMIQAGKKVYVSSLVLDDNLPENAGYIAVKMDIVTEEEPDLEPGTHYEISISPVEVKQPESVKQKLSKTFRKRRKKKV
jgi:hypothetical protein